MTLDCKIEGLNPTTGARREEIVKKFMSRWWHYGIKTSLSDTI
jgi:hypothetical protein